MIELSWNNAVWEAMENLRCLFCFDAKSPYFSLDEVFLACEKKLSLLGAPEREINLRLFALALYCGKIYSRAYFESAVFTRFCESLNFSSFRRIAEVLLKEGSFALIIYWAVLRCSFADFSRNAYLTLENEMKELLLSRGFSPVLI